MKLNNFCSNNKANLTEINYLFTNSLQINKAFL